MTECNRNVAIPANIEIAHADRTTAADEI